MSTRKCSLCNANTRKLRTRSLVHTHIIIIISCMLEFHGIYFRPFALQSIRNSILCASALGRNIFGTQKKKEDFPCFELSRYFSTGCHSNLLSFMTLSLSLFFPLPQNFYFSVTDRPVLVPCKC